MPTTQIAHHRGDDQGALQSGYDLWLGQFDDGELLLDGYVKVLGGLKHFVGRPPDTRLMTALHLTLTHGFFSNRPYRLAGRCDGSINAPVLALYLDFCTRHELDAQALYAEAYPGERALEGETVISFAYWQGVLIPHTWTAACFRGLLESLTQINHLSLGSVLEDATAGLSFPEGVLEREGYTCFRGTIRCYGPRRASRGVTSSRPPASRSGTTTPGRVRTGSCPDTTGCRSSQSRPAGMATRLLPAD